MIVSAILSGSERERAWRESEFDSMRATRSTTLCNNNNNNDQRVTLTVAAVRF